jgi:uncharacterized protein YjbI with pentapeptide repeats
VAIGAAVCVSAPSLAELNKYEALAGGEFGNGTAQQYGEATLPGHDFHGEVGRLAHAPMHACSVQPFRRGAAGSGFAAVQDLRRANFTAADCRKCNFKDANLQGSCEWLRAVSFKRGSGVLLLLTQPLCTADFIKSVVPFANFENANLSDVLMDRAVLNEANLKNANLQRAVLTRSDLGGAHVIWHRHPISCSRPGMALSFQSRGRRG